MFFQNFIKFNFLVLFFYFSLYFCTSFFKIPVKSKEKKIVLLFIKFVIQWKQKIHYFCINFLPIWKVFVLIKSISIIKKNFKQKINIFEFMLHGNVKSDSSVPSSAFDVYEHGIFVFNNSSQCFDLYHF